MGWGDDLMWLGDAAAEYQRTGKKQRPTENSRTRPESPLWLHCDYVAMQDGESLPIRINGLRAYRQPEPWHAKPARLTLSPEEEVKSLAWLRLKPYVLIQPWVKPHAYYANKQWSLTEWQRLVAMIHLARPHLRLISLVDKPHRELTGTEYHHTEHIRLTLPAMRACEFVVTQEGYWHHLAAAYAKPCVVLYGGNTSPHRSELHQHWGTGYPGQLNITDTHRLTPCYAKTRCDHCDQAWQRIRAEDVYQQLDDYLKEREL